MSACDEVREFLFEGDWSQGGLQAAAEAFAHLQSCPKCAQLARDYDRLRSAFKSETPDTPEGGWDAMEKRLLDKTLRRGQRRQFIVRAIAASLLIATVGYAIGRLTGNNTPPPDSVAVVNRADKQENAAAFTPTDISQQVKAFDEVSGVFEHRTAWLVMGDHTSDMGISDKAMDRQNKVLLLRLTMLQSGKIVSNADLVILPGQTANLTMPANADTSVHYRVSTSENQPTRLNISTQLTSSKGTEVLAALATTLRLEPGQKLSAGNMVTNAGDYELQVAFGRADLDRPDAPTAP